MEKAKKRVTILAGMDFGRSDQAGLVLVKKEDESPKFYSIQSPEEKVINKNPLIKNKNEHNNKKS